MSKTAVIFPGQGSQYVGMGLEFYRQFSGAKAYFEEADRLLGYSLSTLIFEGPQEELRITKHTQPAILVTSLAIWSSLQELGITPSFMAGHSLGEYSALVAAGSLDFKDAVQLVKKRGQFMEEAVPNGKGTMTAIMGMDRQPLEKICDEITAKGHSVELANLNTPNQIVISGTGKGVELASELAKEEGARRIIPLSVSGPFHSRLMQPAKEQLQPLIYDTATNEAAIPVVMNVTARPEANPSAIKQNLIDQVVSPVLWTDTVEWMIANGVDTFIEVGPGNVLSGLVKKINRKATAISIDDLASLDTLKEEFDLKGGE